MPNRSEPISGIPASNVAGMASTGFVSPQSTVSVTHKFDERANLTKLYARAYYGHEKKVHYNVYVTRAGSGTTNNLVQTVAGPDSSESRLSGNGETFELELAQPVDEDDELTFEIENEDTNAQPVNLFVSAEYDRDIWRLL